MSIWLGRDDEAAAEAAAAFEAETGLRRIEGDLDPVVVDADKARAADRAGRRSRSSLPPHLSRVVTFAL